MAERKIAKCDLTELLSKTELLPDAQAKEVFAAIIELRADGSAILSLEDLQVDLPDLESCFIETDFESSQPLDVEPESLDDGCSPSLESPAEASLEEKINDLIDASRKSAPCHGFEPSGDKPLAGAEGDVSPYEQLLRDREWLNITMATRNELLTSESPLSKIEIPWRIRETLSRDGIRTIGDLIPSLNDFKSARNIGPGSLKELENELMLKSHTSSDAYYKYQIDFMCSLSGSKEFFFDRFGVLSARFKTVLKEGDFPGIDNRMEGEANSETISQNLNISSLGVPETLVHLLRRHRIYTVGQIQEIGEEGLLELRGVGAFKVNLIMDALASYGYDREDFRTCHKMSISSFQDAFSNEAKKAMKGLLALAKDRNCPINRGSFIATYLPQIEDQISRGGSPLSASTALISRIESSETLAEVCRSYLLEKTNLPSKKKPGTVSQVTYPNGLAWGKAAQKLSEENPNIQNDPDACVLTLRTPGIED